MSDRTQYIGTSVFFFFLFLGVLVMKLMAMSMGLSTATPIDIGQVRDIALFVEFAFCGILLTILWQFSHKWYKVIRITVFGASALIMFWALLHTAWNGEFQRVAELITAWACH